jgi:hypothetical protein
MNRYTFSLFFTHEAKVVSNSLRPIRQNFAEKSILQYFHTNLPVTQLSMNPTSNVCAIGSQISGK